MGEDFFVKKVKKEKNASKWQIMAEKRRCVADFFLKASTFIQGCLGFFKIAFDNRRERCYNIFTKKKDTW